MPEWESETGCRRRGPVASQDARRRTALGRLIEVWLRGRSARGRMHRKSEREPVRMPLTHGGSAGPPGPANDRRMAVMLAMRREGRGGVLAIILAVLVLASGAVRAQDRAFRPVEVLKKQALLIGNAQYEHTTALKNTLADVRELEGALQALGFDAVTRRENLSMSGMLEAVDDFASELGQGDLAFFYYSGHGLQADGKNFLLPVDFSQTKSVAMMRAKALEADVVRETMEETGARLRVLVLDACRDNPFAGTRSGAGGLAAMNARAEGDLIAYATAAGQTASDNPGGDLGLYMTHLLPELRRSNVELEEAFERTQLAVWEASGKRQFPAVYDNMAGKFYLRGGPAGAMPEVPSPQPAERPQMREMTAAERWEEIKGTESRAVLREYAREYGNQPGAAVWVKLAQLRLDRLVTVRLEREAGTAWAAVRDLDSTDALAAFVETYGEIASAADWLNEARRRLAELRMQAQAAERWEEIEGTESQQDLEAFIKEYDGQLGTADAVLRARTRLAELRRRAARKVEAARLALEAARDTGTVAALEAYIRMHGTVPGTSHWVREARERLEGLRIELEVARAREAVEAMEFARIPPGEFRMGSKSKFGFSDERPVTRVRISEGFWMGKHEVTQGQWEAVMGSNPSHFKHCGRDCPVESVSWEEVQQFIGKLNAMEGGARYRLPTEAEWEYAARAGSRTDTPAGDLRVLGLYNAPLLDGMAWYGGNSGVRYEGGFECSGWEEKQYSSDHCGPHPVGLKAPNAFGLHDMLGNVWEWAQDWYGDYPGGAVTDPQGPSAGLYRVLRGGSWRYLARGCRASDRYGLAPGHRFYDLGFRLLRTD